MNRPVLAALLLFASTSLAAAGQEPPPTDELTDFAKQIPVADLYHDEKAVANPCVDCHKDKTNASAAEELRKWPGISSWRVGE